MDMLSMPGDRGVTVGLCPGYRQEGKVHAGKGMGAMLRRACSIRTGVKCWVTRVGLGDRGRCPLGRGWGREPLCIRTSGWRQDKRMYYVIQKSFLWVAGVPDHEPGGFQSSTSPSLAPRSLWRPAWQRLPHSHPSHMVSESETRAGS